MQALDVVLLGRPVAAPLLGEDVHDDRSVPLGGVGEGLLHHVDVVTVDRTGVAHAERFEEGVRGHHFPQGAGHRVHAGDGQRAEGGEAAEAVPQPLACLGVGRVQAQTGQALRQLRHGGGVGAPVVVEDDDDPAPGVPEVVEGLIGHAAGQSAVADHGDHPSLGVLTAHREGLGDAVGVGQGGGGVAVLDPVVLGLGPVRVPGHPAGLLEGLEAEPSSRQQLVHVGLMARVPQDDVAG